MTKLTGIFALLALWFAVPVGGAEAFVPAAVVLGLNASEEAALRDVQPGGVVVWPRFLAERMRWPRARVQIAPLPGPPLIFSDRPEYFLAGNGISLREEVEPGVARVYIYHVPEPSGSAKTISATIENLGRNAMSFRWLRRAFPKPGGDYNRIASEALAAFLSSVPEESHRTVAAGEYATIDPVMDGTKAVRDQLVHGIYEIEFDQPARITVFQRDPGPTARDFLRGLPVLPANLTGRTNASGAGRGLFPVADFMVTNAPGSVIDTSNGPSQLLFGVFRRTNSIADSAPESDWIRGHDSLSGGEEVRNVGNYGVLYHVRLEWRSGDGRGLALLLGKASAGGQWCRRLAAAMWVSGGVWPAGVVRLPARGGGFGEPGEAAVIRKFPPPPAGKTGVIEFIYSPPGAACIPTPILLVPYEL